MTIDNDTKLITRAFVRAWDAADDDAKYNLVCRQVARHGDLDVLTGWIVDQMAKP